MPKSILEESRQARHGIFRFVFKKKFLLIFLLLVLVSASAYYFLGRGQARTNVASTIRQAVVKREDLRLAVAASGKVVARDGVELSFPVTGNLEVSDVYVKEGDKVKKGDKIAAVKTENLEFELRSAYANYQAALANFNAKQESATASELAKAKTAIDQAQVSYDQSKISLEQTKTSAAQSVANAEASLATAANNLKLNNSINDSEIVRNSYVSLINTIKSINISLQKIFRDSDSILGVDDTLANADFKDVLGARNYISVWTAKDSYVLAKTARMQLDQSANKLDSNISQETVDQAAQTAMNALIKLQDHLIDLQAVIEATITSIDFSQAQLDTFKSTIISNRTSVNSAIASLNSATQAVFSSKNSLNQYEIAYNKATNDLQVAKSQAEQNINNAVISVKSRELALKQAQNDYQDLIAPAKESDLASARSQLTSAAISVDRAKYNVGQATLISPIDGVIAMLNYKAGDIILSDSAKTMATIINNDTLFIEANIEESDVSKLKVGDQARVTFDAVDGLNLKGEISFISLTSETSSNGIVTYLVRVLLSNAGASGIREGMTASIEFVTAEALNVLTVPVAAVRNIAGSPAVELSNASIANVVTGFTDGKKVEIISGLQEGDQFVY